MLGTTDTECLLAKPAKLLGHQLQQFAWEFSFIYC